MCEIEYFLQKMHCSAQSLFVGPRLGYYGTWPIIYYFVVYNKANSQQRFGSETILLCQFTTFANWA